MRENLPKRKDRMYAINLKDKQSKGTHWVVLFIYKNKAVYYVSFGTEHIL